MVASFDNMRKQATRNMNNLFKEIKAISEMDNWELEDYDFNELKRLFNEAGLSVDMLNCLQDEKEPKQYHSLDIEVYRFKLEEY